MTKQQTWTVQDLVAYFSAVRAGRKDDGPPTSRSASQMPPTIDGVTMPKDLPQKASTANTERPVPDEPEDTSDTETTASGHDHNDFNIEHTEASSTQNAETTPNLHPDMNSPPERDDASEQDGPPKQDRFKKSGAALKEWLFRNDVVLLGAAGGSIVSLSQSLVFQAQTPELLCCQGFYWLCDCKPANDACWNFFQDTSGCHGRRDWRYGALYFFEIYKEKLWTVFIVLAIWVANRA